MSHIKCHCKLTIQNQSSSNEIEPTGGLIRTYGMFCVPSVLDYFMNECGTPSLISFVTFHLSHSRLNVSGGL